MKIAELFVQLGFKADGDAQLATMDRNLGRAQVSAAGLLVGVAALNAAFLVLMNRAIDTAVGLDMWRRSTSLSTDELQRQQYGAARANVALKTVADALQQIQKVRAEISLGNVDASSPWFMLGIDPRQDPLKVLEQLRAALAKMDPALARNFVSRMGFGDDLLYLLQQKKSLGSLFVSGEEIDRLTKLGGAWKAFLFTVSTVATKFAATFAEGLTKVVLALEKGAIWLNRWTTWLNSGTSQANAAKAALLSLAVIIGFLAIGLTAIIALLGLLKAILLAIQLIPIVIAATAFVGVLLLMAAALTYLILYVEDFWTALQGGKSLNDWNEGLIMTVRNVDRLARAMEWAYDAASKLWAGMKNIATTSKGYGFGSLGQSLFGSPAGYYFQPGPLMGAGGNRQTTNNVEINVDGAGDPVQVGREVGRSVKREISDAMGTMPIPTK